MLAQGPFPRAADPDFGLIETFRWSRERGYDYLAEHLARLDGSASALQFRFDRVAVERRLNAEAADFAISPARVRLVLSRDGSMDLTSAALGMMPPASYRVAIAAPRQPADDPWLRHKTTMRDRYERPLAEAMAAVTADEVLFLNERDELCEGARSNLFVRQGDHLLTPTLSCGLLPGTLRANLLASGIAREAVLRRADLDTAPEWFLGNSVRGLVRSRLVVGPA